MTPSAAAAAGNGRKTASAFSPAMHLTTAAAVLLLLTHAAVAGTSPTSCYRTSNYFRTHFNDTSNVLEQPAPGKSDFCC